MLDIVTLGAGYNIFLDPGSTTGVAVIQPPATLLFAGQEWDRSELLTWVRRQRPEAVVVEDFRPYEGLPTWADMPAPRFIGALEELGLKVVKQQPTCKRTFPNELLEAAGMLQRGKPHANDAIRHGLYYTWFTLGHLKDEAVQAIYRTHIYNTSLGRVKRGSKR